MRKKQNYQRTDYSQNGELLCFGLSEHSLTEFLPRLSEKAKKDVELLHGWFANRDNIAVRPSYKSDFSTNTDLARTQLRVLLGLLLIRELPIKSFSTRCIIMYIYGTYFIGRGLARGLRSYRPGVYYGTDYSNRALLNHPDFYDFAVTRILPKLPLGKDAHKQWRLRQQPVYHQYHRCTYRYRWRKPRYVPWDGTMNQPVMPFFIDDSTGVINGTFRRNANTDPEFK